MKTIKIIGCILSLLLTTNLALALGGVTFWEVDKQTDIQKGDLQAVSISDDGLISLSPTFSEIFNTEQPFIFATAADLSGNIYLGTGHDGRVYKVDKSGKGSVFFDSSELDVTALTTDNLGNLYVGTSPDGKVYSINSDGKVKEFFDPEDKYIWSLAFDKNGDLFVGTGDKGVIYKVDSQGKNSVFAKTNEKHIICLTPDRDGNLLAGTDGNGLVLRFAPTGKMFALFDSPLQEIHQLAQATDGTIYALAISGQNPDKSSTASTTTNNATAGESVTITISAATDDDIIVADSPTTTTTTTTTTTQSRSTDTSGSKAVLYQITPDGGNDVIWTTKDTTALSLAIKNDGQVLVGTTQKGRIYSIDPKTKKSTLLVQSSEEQTSSLISSQNNIYVASSNSGKLFRLGSDTAKEGFYTSPIHDTKLTASWGQISWRSNGNVELQTRSGNTTIPDNTWSDWSSPYQGTEGKPISSPAARFIQWRAKLLPNGSLTGVRVAYLPRNVAPEVTKISILPAGVALQDIPQQPIDPGIISAGLDPTSFGLPVSIQPRKVFQKGARSIQWEAQDRNSDSLIYSLYYKTTNEAEWHLLAADLKNNYYTLDADALADGKYSFRVVASDSPTNALDRALKGELISDIIDIDNIPPQVSVSQPKINGRQVEVTFSVADNLSILRRAEYSLDGGNWQVVFPEDGIADSRKENFVVKVEVSQPGEHIITLRCYDESANSGGNKVSFKIK